MYDYSTLVTFGITIINIIILYFILRLILFKPVTKFIAKRSQKIKKDLDDAARDKSESEKALAQYREKLKEADVEAQNIIREARIKAETEAAQIIAEGKTKAEAMAAASAKRLEAEQQAAIARFNLEAVALVMAASARLAQREFSSDKDRQYIQMLLGEIGKSGVSQ